MSGLFDRLQDEINALNSGKGLSPIDLLDMPEGMADIVNQIVRHNGMSLPDIAEALEKSPKETRQALDELAEKGYLRRIEVNDEIWYKAQFGRKADKVISDNIWSALDNATKKKK